MAHRVTLIPGDGTGPELTKATAGSRGDRRRLRMGRPVRGKRRHGLLRRKPLPDGVLEAIRQSGIALKGPITTPIGGGFRSVNVALRKGLDLYDQVRPCKTYQASARVTRTSIS